MGASKAHARVLDGPYASWAGVDEQCQLLLPTTGTNLANRIKLGQAVYLDVVELGPDANVPNNASGIQVNSGTVANQFETFNPLCEIVVQSQISNGGPCFGVVTGVQVQAGMSFSMVAGVPTWTNTGTAALLVTLTVRQLGWGYVFVGTNAGNSVRKSILVGSTLVKDAGVPYAILGTASMGNTIGTALATAINTYQATGQTAAQSSITSVTTATTVAAPLGPGLVSIIPTNLAGLVPPAMILIDSLSSGVQEAVSVGSISYPTFSVALANAHAAGFQITGPNSPPAASSVLISTAGAGSQTTGLVAAWINVLA